MPQRTNGGSISLRQEPVQRVHERDRVDWNATGRRPGHEAKVQVGRGWDVSYDTTIGWSLFSSGVVTLLLIWLPGDSLYWGIGLLAVGLAVLSRRLT
jgi:hypothetical protein